jgi:hydrogenase maturation protease
MNAKQNRTAIIALGDTDLRDAGTGQYLLELISEIELPGNVDVYNCGMSTDCIDRDVRLYDRIILITAHNHGDAAGEILFTTIASDIESVLKGLPSPLQRIKDQLIKLFILTSRERQVEWILIGIEPKSIIHGATISDDVIKAAPRVLNFISDLLQESAQRQTVS